MKTPQRGYILLTTLLMMGIVTILVLSLMQGVYLDLKMSNQLTKTHDEFYQLESSAQKIKNHMSAYTLRPCVIHEWDPNRIDAALLRQQGCRLNDSQTESQRYIISDLGIFPCLEIILEDVGYASHHWLISIMSERRPSYLLQLRTAVPEPESLATCELAQKRSIRAGMISWRHVSF
ncbi:MAG: hypothetical protein Q8R24_07800 [Legionellaceae bacterium]|nr:hypothetical protein [Legionellaceae bacterium]